MKIYTKIVIDIITGEVLEEDSFEYSGPLALCREGAGDPGEGDPGGPGEGTEGEGETEGGETDFGGMAFEGTEFEQSWSEVSVGPDMSAALGYEGAREGGMSSDDAMDVAHNIHSQKTAAMTSMPELVEAIKGSKSFQGFMSMFGQKESQFDVEKPGEINIDPFGFEEEFGAMPSIELGTPTPSKQMQFSPTEMPEFSVMQSAINKAAQDMQAVQAIMDPWSFAKKAGKKPATKAVTMFGATKAAGLPTSLATKASLTAAVTAAPVAMIGAMIGTVSAHYSRTQDAQASFEAAVAHGIEAGYTRDEVVAGIAKASNLSVEDVEKMGANISAAAIGGPEAETTGVEDPSKQEVGLMDVGGGAETPERWGTYSSPLRDYLGGGLLSQATPSQPGFMTSPYEAKLPKVYGA